MRAAVLGAGSWGTTFAKVLVDAGNDVTLWARRPELAERIAKEHANPDYLPEIALPQQLQATHDAELALFGTSLGVDLEAGTPVPGGHRHHMRAINAINRVGGIRAAVETGVLTKYAQQVSSASQGAVTAYS